MAKFKATFRIGAGPAITAMGREAETIIALMKAGPKGMTSLEMHRADWTLRLGDYIFDLKAMGVPICSTWELHARGNHARYYLAGPVELVQLIRPQEHINLVDA